MIKEYREMKGITQTELVAEMKPTFPWMDASLISKMENGLCEPTAEVREWICKAEKSLVDERLAGICIVYPPEEKTAETADFSPLMRMVYEALLDTDIDHRLSRYRLSKLTGKSDRKAREIIEELRGIGIRVGSESGAEGYWLIHSEEEYKTFIKQYCSRAYTIIDHKNAMDNYVEGQIRI